MKQSFVTAHRLSPLDQAQRLKNGEAGPKAHRDLAPALPLTSLIDAFSIIVIYLLIGTQSGGLEADIPHRMQLPSAESGTPVENVPVLRVENGVYFLNDEAIRGSDLATRLAGLKSAKSAFEILVQADRTMSYAALDPVLRASSQAGLQKLKFAVIPAK